MRPNRPSPTPHPIIAIIAAAILALSACATLPPDPTLLNNAQSAIMQAEQVGAQEYSPLELRFARERLEAAIEALELDDAEHARRLADGAEIEAQLALARTQAALARAELAEKQRALDALKADLVEAYGEGVLR
jgi:hypothetical protein